MNKTLRNALAIFCAVVFLAAAITVIVVVCGRHEQTIEPGPETGMYYYDADDGDTYYVTLSGGDKVSMQIKGALLSGRYTLADGSFAFELDTETAVSATYADQVVNLTYAGSAMRFLRTENYTVTFDANGGSAVEAVKVMNGKTVAKPADPVREGYVFLGWYADSSYATAFSFGAAPVTANTTVYARWSEKLTGTAVYSVDFDLNYAGADRLDPVSTVGGKIYDVPAPVREGYEFCGWWISDYEVADKLTYRYSADCVFEANTTLFALWESSSSSKLAAPTVRVEGDSVVWDPVTGVSAYEVEIVGPKGNTLVSRRTGATSILANFSSADAGEYRIGVRAIASNEANSSDEAVRYYNNKALTRVSLFSVVEPSVLLFNAVEGAENYKITVVCGNSAHNHADFDNGTSTYFSFANCTLAENGIAFTVTASAAGKASSTSETFYYNRVLNKIENFYFESENEIVRWDAVENAADYAVTVTSGSQVYSFETNGKTYVSLKGYAASEVKVSVAPVTAGYNSPAASEYTFARTVLAAPSGLKITGNELSWDASIGADSYTVCVNGYEYAGIEGNRYDLSELSLANGVDYEITVKAVGATESVWSDGITAQYYSLASEIFYAANTVNWKPMIGATSYNVKVNDGAVVSVAAGESSVAVTLTKTGENTVAVQAIDDAGNVTDWQTVTVYAYELAFDSREGSAADSLYLANGDKVTLPTSTRAGYELSGWYNVPGTASANGAAFADGSEFSAVGDTVLYAYWTSKSYRVTYITDGELDQTTASVGYMNDYKLEAPETSDTSLAFVGWYTEADGQGVQLTDSEGYSVAPWTFMEDQDVYPYRIEIFKFTLQTEGTLIDTYAVVATTQVSLVSKVTIPAKYNDKDVSVIEGYAFQNLTSLKTIEIPDTIQIIYTETAFEGCTSLQAVNVYAAGARVPEYSSHEGVLYRTSEVAEQGKTLVFVPTAKTGDYRIADDAKAIGAQSFENSKLSSVTIPSSVDSIGTEAFLNCTNLADVYFDLDYDEEVNGKLTIEESAFSGCKKLRSLTLPARFETFDPAIVGDSTTFENLYVADDHEIYSSVNGLLCNKAGDTILYCPVSRRGALRIPNTIRKISAEAFKDCRYITQLTFSGFIREIGESAFANCTRLITVTFAGGNTLGDALTLGNSAFANCGNLSSVNFEENSNVVSLGANVFDGCAKLSSFELSATIKDLSVDTFVGMNVSKLTVNENNPYYTAEENVLFSKDKSLLLYYSPYLTVTEYELPATVKEIGANAFSGNLVLETVILGSQLEIIGEKAFYGSNLYEVVFAESAEPVQTTLTIGASAFEACSSLYALYVPNPEAAKEDDAATDEGTEESEPYVYGTPANLRTIGDRAFYGARLMTVVLSEGLESIGEYAFSGSGTCWVMSLSLPASLKHIGAYAFYNNRYCNDFSLAEESQLETIGEDAFYRVPIKTFTVPKTVTEIGAYAFASTNLADGFFFEKGRTEGIKLGQSLFSNTKLTSITFPDDCEFYDIYTSPYDETVSWMVTPIDDASYLTEINNIPEHETYTFNDGVFYIKNVSGDPDIVDHAVYKEHDYVIPNTVTKIENGAFARLSGSVAFEAGGTADLVIAKYAFAYAKMTSIAFPARLAKFEGDFHLTGDYTISNELQDMQFRGATVESITFEDTDENPSRLEVISDGVFYGITGLTELTLPRSVKKIGYMAFAASWSAESVLEKVVLNEGLEEIAQYAFADDFSDITPLTSVTIPSTVRYIGPGAFSGSGGALTEVTFAKDENGNCALEIIGDSAFRRSGITTITLPKSLAGSAYTTKDGVEVPDGKLGGSMFYSCKSLETVIFEAGCPLITEYGNRVFAACTAYTEVTFPVNITKIGVWDSDSSGTIKKVTVPKGFDEESLLNIATALVGLNVGGFVLEEGNLNLYQDVRGEGDEAVYGAIYDKDKTKLLYYPSCYTAEEYTLLESTVEIVEKAFYENKTLKRVILNDGLKTIGAYAFAVSNDKSTSALESIEIPGTVETIGEQAFYSATKLESVTFKKYKKAEEEEGSTALTTVGNQAFWGCTSLKEIEIPDSVDVLGVATTSWYNRPSYAPSVFYNCTSLEKVTLSVKMNEIAAQTFGNCTSLKEVVVKQNSALQKICQYAFNGSGLETVDFSKATALNEIAEGAFYNCEQLETIKFASTQQEIRIGDSAFENTGFESFDLVANIVSIGDKAFYNVANLTELNITDGSKLKTIGDNAFGGTALEAVAFDKLTELETIGSYAFYMLGLSEIKLADKVETVGDYAFYGCEKVTELELSKSIATIGRYAFAKLPLIESVTVYGNNTTVGASAFEDCTSLAEITLNSGVDSLGNSAFGFTAVTELVLPETLSSLEGNPFAGCPLETLEIRSAAADFLFDNESKSLFSKDKSLLYYVSTTASGVYVLDENVSSVMAGAFAGSDITSITLPATFTTIAEGTFRNCTKLESITIGKNITSIGAYAFEGCTSLSSVTFEHGGTKAIAIGEGAFKGCTALETIELPHRLRDSVRIVEESSWFWPDMVFEKEYATPGLGAYAFENSGLVTVTYEAEPTVNADAYSKYTLAMGEGVFRNCVKLESAAFDHQLNNGQYDEWDVQGYCIGDYAFYGCTSLSSVTLQEHGGATSRYEESGYYDTLSSVGAYAFYGCSSLTSFTTNYYVVSFGPYCFAKSGLTSMTLMRLDDGWGDETGYSINEGVFYECVNLKSFTANGLIGSIMGNLGYSSTVVGEKAFYGCTSLETVYMANVNAIMESCFENCTALREATIHVGDNNMWLEDTIDGNEWIEANAFKNCSSLTKAEITGNLYGIGANVFEGCSSLTEISLPKNLQSISETAFYGWTAEQTIKVPFAEDKVPGTWSVGWSADATVEYETASSEETEGGDESGTEGDGEIIVDGEGGGTIIVQPDEGGGTIIVQPDEGGVEIVYPED